ncbi:MAG: N-acetyltransferase [Gemmatimonadetes bacterium]|jgi:predicted GNAT family acetyltransferase|nr:N-acetyltransferase [Gemmatimonadota bacterium]
MSLIHDRAASRFRLPLEDGGEAFIEYVEPDSGTLDLLHTVVPPAARGEGIGSGLVEQVLRYARDQDLRIVPSCPFVAAYLQEHPEYRELPAGALALCPQ